MKQSVFNTSGVLPDIGGVQVYQSTAAVNLEPIKKHTLKPGMKASYHKRIQKKWNKRHGVNPVPCAYQVGDRLMVHPVIYNQLMRGYR